MTQVIFIHSFSHFHFLCTPSTVSTVNTSAYVKKINKLHPSIHFNVVFFIYFFTPSSKVSLSIQSSCFDLNLFTQPSLFYSPQNITITVCTCSRCPAQHDSPPLDSKNQHLTLDKTSRHHDTAKLPAPLQMKKPFRCFQRFRLQIRRWPFQTICDQCVWQPCGILYLSFPNKR